jgi:hypothetical protein
MDESLIHNLIQDRAYAIARSPRIIRIRGKATVIDLLPLEKGGLAIAPLTEAVASGISGIALALACATRIIDDSFVESTVFQLGETIVDSILQFNNADISRWFPRRNEAYEGISGTVWALAWLGYLLHQPEWRNLAHHTARYMLEEICARCATGPRHKLPRYLQSVSCLIRADESLLTPEWNELIQLMVSGPLCRFDRFITGKGIRSSLPGTLFHAIQLSAFSDPPSAHVLSLARRIRQLLPNLTTSERLGAAMTGVSLSMACGSSDLHNVARYDDLTRVAELAKLANDRAPRDVENILTRYRLRSREDVLHERSLSALFGISGKILALCQLSDPEMPSFRSLSPAPDGRPNT